MSDGKITVSGVGGRYASALFDLAHDQNALDSVENNLGDLSNMLKASPDLNRPAPAPLYLLRGRRRIRFLLQGPMARDLQEYLRDWLPRHKAPAHIRRAVDIDPYSFM